MKKEKIIVIGGGVGPMAGVILHKKIIENTLTNGTDQSHLEIHHLSRSHDVADRTNFLFGKTKINPAEGMFRTIQAAEKAAIILEKKAVVGIPCNTFHAPKIFKYFLQLIKNNNVKAQVLHMLKETADLISEIAPQAKKIGLMSTTGTRQSGVYKKILEPLGFEIIEVSKNLQSELHQSIYNREWGIKAVNPVSSKTRDNFKKYAHYLYQQGVEIIILGCTEIPLALPEKKFKTIPLIDPMFALARALIREANDKKLKPLSGII